MVWSSLLAAEESDAALDVVTAASPDSVAAAGVEPSPAAALPLPASLSSSMMFSLPSSSMRQVYMSSNLVFSPTDFLCLRRHAIIVRSSLRKLSATGRSTRSYSVAAECPLYSAPWSALYRSSAERTFSASEYRVSGVIVRLARSSATSPSNPALTLAESSRSSFSRCRRVCSSRCAASFRSTPSSRSMSDVPSAARSPLRAATGSSLQSVSQLVRELMASATAGTLRTSLSTASALFFLSSSSPFSFFSSSYRKSFHASSRRSSVSIASYRGSSLMRSRTLDRHDERDEICPAIASARSMSVNSFRAVEKRRCTSSRSALPRLLTNSEKSCFRSPIVRTALKRPSSLMTRNAYSHVAFSGSSASRSSSRNAATASSLLSKAGASVFGLNPCSAPVRARLGCGSACSLSCCS